MSIRKTQGEYYFIDFQLELTKTYGWFITEDNERYEAGNYFITEEEALKVLKVVKSLRQ